MLYNTVTKKLYDGEKGIEVIPVFYKLTYPEWAPFDKSEGRAAHQRRGVFLRQLEYLSGIGQGEGNASTLIFVSRGDTHVEEL